MKKVTYTAKNPRWTAFYTLSGLRVRVVWNVFVYSIVNNAMTNL